MKTEKTKRLERLLKRVERITEEVWQLKEEIEAEDLFPIYYRDERQAGDEAMWFHDEGMPWNAKDLLILSIGQLEHEDDLLRKMQEQSGVSEPEDIPF